MIQPPSTVPVRTPPSKPEQPSHASKPWFHNVASECGIDFQYVSGQSEKRYMPEIMAGGVCLFDYDQDGYLDVYFVQGGRVVGPREHLPTNRLFHNRGDGTFEDVTTSSHTGHQGYGIGCACGDYDNDGRTDLYVTNVGPNVLYRNNGDGTFSDVTAQTGTGDPSFSSSAAFVDIDHDGDLDLYVANYINWSPELEIECKAWNGDIDYCKPTHYDAPARDTLYRNLGDGTFMDITESSRISSAISNGLGVVCADFNMDGWMDIAIANDEMANFLWINSGDGTFRDEALERGAAYSGDGAPEAGMGIDARDIDDDGDVDLFMSHVENETNTLYINNDQFMEDRTNEFGLSSSRPFTGFGTALVDLNNDGLLDLYVANGRVYVTRGQMYTQINGRLQYDPYSEPNLLYRGIGQGSFQEVFPRGGTDQNEYHTSRAVAFGDYDNDGDIDIFVVNRDAPAYVLQNLNHPAGNWITFRVVNKYGSDAIGARVHIVVNGKKRFHDVRAAYSYCASNDPRVHFGLGPYDYIDRVRVTWPDGEIQSFGDFTADQIVELRRNQYASP